MSLESSGLIAANDARLKARDDYIAMLNETRPILDEQTRIMAGYEDYVHECSVARTNIKGYLEDNIIHKDISIDRPDDSNWMAIPLLANRTRIYTRGPEEVRLIKGFVERRRDDLSSLAGEYDTKGEEIIESMEVTGEAGTLEAELRMELELAEFEMRFASIQRLYAHVIFLESIAQHQDDNRETL